MKKFLKIASIVCLIVTQFMFLIIIYNTVNEIAYNQYATLKYIDYLNEANAFRNALLERKIQRTATVQKETKPSYEKLKAVTVRMKCYLDETLTKGWVGTGTIVKVTEDFTYVLTNKHVAPKNSKYLYIIKNGKQYKAEVLKVGVTRDLSLVRMVGKIPNTSVIKGLKKVKEQDKVYSVGMYLGFQDIYTEGTVAGWWGRDAESRLMNMPCLNGCSGSGVFDKDGNLVAVVYAGSVYNMFGGFDTAKAICVPFIAIYTFLEEIL